MRPRPLHTALAIFRKDFKTLFRDRSALVFIFGLPIVFTVIFGSVFGNRSGQGSGSPMKLLVANLDAGKQGANLLDSMRAVGLSAEVEPGGEAAARRKVQNGQRAVAVIVPPEFSVQLERYAAQMVGQEPASPAQLRLLVDPAQSDIAAMVKGAIVASVQRTMGQILKSQGFGAQNDQPPVTLEMQTLTNAEAGRKPSAGDLMIPGFAVYFVFFMANGVAVTLLTERQEGTLRRMLSAPIGRGEILFGKLLARGLLGLIQTAILFGIGIVWMKLHLGGALLGVAAVALVTIFAATGLGLLIASMGRTQEQIQGMTTLALLVMGLLSGCLFPRALMPEAMQRFSLITPHAWALTAYQDLLLRHKPLFATFGNLVVVFLFGAAFFALALKRFQYE